MDAEIAEPTMPPEALTQMRRMGLPKPAAVSDAEWALAVPAAPAKTSADRARELAAADPDAAMRELLPDSVFTLGQIQSDPSHKQQLLAAMFVHDKVTGKATQKVEHTGSIAIDFRKLASDLRDREQEVAELRALAGLSARDVTTAIPLDSSEALIDSFLEAKKLVGHTVGQRGSTDGEITKQQSEQGIPAGDHEGIQDAEQPSEEAIQLA